MIRYTIFFLTIFLYSCQQSQSINKECEEQIVVCFDHYQPKPYKTPGGSKHIPMPKVLYTDNTEVLREYMPEADFDTIILQSPEHFKELALNYRDFEFIYYPLMQGDTITISMDNLDYPILSSKHHPERNRIYNMNYELRKGRTHSGLEAKTCLGSDWVRIAQNIDVIRANNWTSLLMNYCPLDSLQSMFSSYKTAYTDTINLFKQQQIISDKIYNHYQYLLALKDYESRRMLNEDTTFYRQMEPEISDKYIRYPSYREFLDYYLWFFNQHIPTIRKSQGGSKDWRQTFDELSPKPFQPKSKQILLERCIKEIGENFSAQDVNSYLDKYIHITQDTLLLNKIRDQYNLSADASQLLLKDIHGKPTNLNILLKKNRGKVIYVDFWASWCVPCREEMPPSAKLRELYKGKNVVFVYLALNDKESSWKKAVEQEGLSEVPNNFFITNSKNSKILEKLKLGLIPRYIIFDKRGNIVEMNAPRPSDQQVTTTIDKYLK
ncbi:TlpA disulfide reductase family protein [Bacteroides helcogenes]|uniref:Redoxin domain protein n=1 Tax=Bacteroides helcogenes (strain ATCC 35417 / DSM 20613 / JCM 6297 / CCUG 15421 / P 36-108) TaxID=693979 RepID=E6SQJ4_BACT6|nr:TlpA disulfide reductase family protein [Bacteroides helcogenes]ADV42968.1 Redoxin domain protein [Bacteroides helcogenes P 36-108]MDY5236989.1 TlpA disulfide reductase family protein [Bacteroides helcogenes]